MTMKLCKWARRWPMRLGLDIHGENAFCGEISALPREQGESVRYILTGEDGSLQRDYSTPWACVLPSPLKGQYTSKITRQFSTTLHKQKLVCSQNSLCSSGGWISEDIWQLQTVQTRVAKMIRAWKQVYMRKAKRIKTTLERQSLRPRGSTVRVYEMTESRTSQKQTSVPNHRQLGWGSSRPQGKPNVSYMREK